MQSYRLAFQQQTHFLYSFAIKIQEKQSNCFHEKKKYGQIDGWKILRTI